MSSRKAEDVLMDIEESEAEDAVEKVLAMSAEERRAALAEAVIDLGELHAKADALYGRTRLTSRR